MLSQFRASYRIFSLGGRGGGGGTEERVWLLVHTLTCYEDKDYTSLTAKKNKLTKIPTLSAVSHGVHWSLLSETFIKLSFFQSEQLQLKDLLVI